jgi:hypothetical protein
MPLHFLKTTMMLTEIEQDVLESIIEELESANLRGDTRLSPHQKAFLFSLWSEWIRIGNIDPDNIAKMLKTVKVNKPQGSKIQDGGR